MTDRHWQHNGLDPVAEQQLVDAARRAGSTRFQVLALVRRRGARHRIWLLDHHGDDVWAVPIAWVHPGETITGTLDWLCSIRLGLSGWEPSFAVTTGFQAPDGGLVRQVAFDVTLATGAEGGWPGKPRWWHTRTEPPTLHPMSQPALELLFGVPPEQ